MDKLDDNLDAAAIVLPGVEVRVVERCTSTNDLLLKENNTVLLAAEEQTAGRGRRGRRWHSAPSAGLTFSLGRRIRRPARELAALSLVAGVAAARALRALGVRQAALKWPNALVVDGAKLGGILVEARTAGGKRSAGSYAVIGIGINCRRTPGLATELGRQVAFLGDFVDFSRTKVLQDIGSALIAALEAFEAGGLDALRAEWEAMDAHAGQRLRVRLAGGRMVTGVAGGLAEDGALRLVTRSGVRAVRSGRVVSARAP
jgi:BirA family transcriptional regulator, biotin operon repressor / biotin---[acetyl-CoA-carboxylase] ligase